VSRLFVFGCSFTRYHWPTWADFLSYGYDEYYNYGKPGGGNKFIFEMICEADVTHNFTTDDTVMVMWSSYNRHDLYKDNRWVTPGNIFNAKPTFNERYIHDYFDIKGSVLHSLNFIHGAQQLLNTRCTWKMASMSDMTYPIGETHMADKILSKFSNNDAFDVFPELAKYKVIFANNWISLPLMTFNHSDQNPYKIQNYSTWDNQIKAMADQHPTISAHLEWLKVVQLDVNLGDAEQLIRRWHKAYPDRKVFSDQGRQWCIENIPHCKR
jgi:hypothetical protein